MTSQPIDPFFRRLFIVVIIIIALFLLKLMLPVIIPFFVAFVLAYIFFAIRVDVFTKPIFQAIFVLTRVLVAI